MKNYKNLELDLVLIENTDIVTSSPFLGAEDGFGDPNTSEQFTGN